MHIKWKKWQPDIKNSEKISGDCIKACFTLHYNYDNSYLYV